MYNFLNFFRPVFIAVFFPLFLIAVFIVILNFLQVYSPNKLPHRLQTWSWLPRPFRTLAWYDEHVFRSKKKLELQLDNEPKELSTISNPNVENYHSHTNNAFTNTDDFNKESIVEN